MFLSPLLLGIFLLRKQFDSKESGPHFQKGLVFRKAYCRFQKFSSFGTGVEILQSESVPFNK